MPYPFAIGNSVRWPGLASAPASIGGRVVTCAQAEAAAEVLLASRTSAVAPVLAAAGHPLAGCDYFAAAAPYLEAARAAPKTGRAGAAGRHVTKHAFIAAIAAACALARAAELDRAMAAFGTDERYAVAMAREAVAIRERAHAAQLRSAVRSAVSVAVAACAVRGPGTCALTSACGTGACPFAPAAMKGLAVPAGPGRFPRPAVHERAGAGFSDAEAAAALLAARPYHVGVPVNDTDAARSEDATAA